MCGNRSSQRIWFDQIFFILFRVSTFWLLMQIQVGETLLCLLNFHTPKLLRQMFPVISLCDLTAVSPQGGRDGDPHPHPKHGRLLRPVWRGEVCHPVRAGGLLHSGERHPARQGRHHHWAQISPQLLRPHHREVCALLLLTCTLTVLTPSRLMWRTLTGFYELPPPTVSG